MEKAYASSILCSVDHLLIQDWFTTWVFQWVKPWFWWQATSYNACYKIL